MMRGTPCNYIRAPDNSVPSDSQYGQEIQSGLAPRADQAIVPIIGHVPMELRNGTFKPSAGGFLKSQWIRGARTTAGGFLTNVTAGGSTLLDRSKPEHTWKAKRIGARSAAGEVEPKPAAGYACGSLGRASTAEIRVSRRGQHRSPVGGYYHKRQEKVNEFGSFLGPDLQAAYSSIHRTRGKFVASLEGDVEGQEEICRHATARTPYGGFHPSYSEDGVRTGTGTRLLQLSTETPPPRRRFTQIPQSLGQDTRRSRSVTAC